MTHRLNLFLLFLAVVIGLPFYWLMLANPTRDIAPRPISMAQLRSLAAQIPGQRPTGAEMLHVGWKLVPGNLYAAGSGMKRRLLGVLVFRLTVPGGGIVIDSGVSGQLGTAMGLDGVLDMRQREAERWMEGAGLILATSERPFHLGGLAAYAGQREAAVALAHARLNRWQVPGQTDDDYTTWPSTLVLRPAITAAAPVAVAPGVVVIPTGNPTPGSQMIYARLADNREMLFAGDVAPFEVNVTELRVRSNLLDRGVQGEARREAMRWLVTLRRLKREAPRMVIVPAHDFEWLHDPMQHSGVEMRRSSEEMQKPAGT